MKTPTTLDEAVDQIVAGMTKAEKRDYMASPEDYPCVGFLGGMAMRNAWGLWHGKTGISRFLRKHRIVHGDDQSLTIFRAVWRRLHQLPIDDAWLAKEAAFYEAFWLDKGLTWDQKEIPGHPGEPKTCTIFVKK